MIKINWKHTNKKILFGSMLILAFLVGFFIKTIVPDRNENNIQPLSDMMQYINHNYLMHLTPERIKELNYMAIEAILKNLDDYSLFFRPKFSESVMNKFNPKKGNNPKDKTANIECKFVDNVGYLKIKFFTINAHQEIKQALLMFNAMGVKGLIIDLRNNPGGITDTAIKAADIFLEENKTITTIYIKKQLTIFQSTAKKNLIFKKPIIILVNHNTASSSEIFAAALQYHKKAILIGIKTEGKGVGQNIKKFKDGSLLILTSFLWLTPDNQNIQDKGLIPDIVVDDPISEYFNLPPQEAITAILKQPR